MSLSLPRRPGRAINFYGDTCLHNVTFIKPAPDGTGAVISINGQERVVDHYDLVFLRGHDETDPEAIYFFTAPAQTPIPTVKFIVDAPHSVVILRDEVKFDSTRNKV